MPREKLEEPPPKTPPLALLIAACAAIVGAVYLAPRLYLLAFGSIGTANDQFTALSALFTGLAFAGLIYATALQRRELELQRRELAMTREELHAQKEEMEEQNATLTAQRFENTFFQLLRSFNEIVQSLHTGETRGRACCR